MQKLKFNKKKIMCNFKSTPKPNVGRYLLTADPSVTLSAPPSRRRECLRAHAHPRVASQSCFSSESFMTDFTAVLCIFIIPTRKPDVL